MAPAVSRGIVLEADQDEKVRALISRGLNYSDFVQAATDVLLSGELAKYGGLTPGESLRRALDRAEDADAMEKSRPYIISMLRAVCEEWGDNDWPDDLFIGDIIEKHLAHHLPPEDDDDPMDGMARDQP